MAWIKMQRSGNQARAQIGTSLYSAYARQAAGEGAKIIFNPQEQRIEAVYQMLPWLGSPQNAARVIGLLVFV